MVFIEVLEISEKYGMFYMYVEQYYCLDLEFILIIEINMVFLFIIEGYYLRGMNYLKQMMFFNLERFTFRFFDKVEIIFQIYRSMLFVVVFIGIEGFEGCLLNNGRNMF